MGWLVFLYSSILDPQLLIAKASSRLLRIAVLSYIGFDGISTLVRRGENPQAKHLLATVLTCFRDRHPVRASKCIAAQLVWPATQPFPNFETAFTYLSPDGLASLCSRYWDSRLLVAELRFGLGAQTRCRPPCSMAWDAARLLPKQFFGERQPQAHVPRNNVLLCRDAIALAGALLVTLACSATD